MKNLLIVIAFMGIGLVTVHAQVNAHGVDTVGRNMLDTPTIPKSQKVVVEQQFVKIKPTELPASIQKVLKNKEYTGWTISSAYHNAPLHIYAVELKKGKETKTYKFDKQGKRLDE